MHCFLGGGVQLGGGEGEAGAEVGGFEVGAEVGLFFLHQGLQVVEVLLQVVEVLLRCVLAVQLFFGFFEPLGQLVVGAGGVEGVLLLYEAGHLDVAALHLAQVEVDDEGGDADGQCEDGEQGDAGVEAADGALLAADLQALLTGVADGGELEGVAVAGAGVDAVLQGLAAALPEEGFGGVAEGLAGFGELAADGGVGGADAVGGLLVALADGGEQGEGLGVVAGFKVVLGQVGLGVDGGFGVGVIGGVFEALHPLLFLGGAGGGVAEAGHLVAEEVVVLAEGPLGDAVGALGGEDEGVESGGELLHAPGQGVGGVEVAVLQGVVEVVAVDVEEVVEGSGYVGVAADAGVEGLPGESGGESGGFVAVQGVAVGVVHLAHAPVGVLFGSFGHGVAVHAEQEEVGVVHGAVQALVLVVQEHDGFAEVEVVLGGALHAVGVEGVAVGFGGLQVFLLVHEDASFHPFQFEEGALAVEAELVEFPEGVVGRLGALEGLAVDAHQGVGGVELPGVGGGGLLPVAGGGEQQGGEQCGEEGEVADNSCLCHDGCRFILAAKVRKKND